MKENSILDREVLEVIRERYEEIFSAEKKVADFVLRNPQKTVDSNVSELAKQSGVSDATVVRMCHHIGYSGYYQFRILLARDLGRKQVDQAASVEHKDMVSRVFAEYAEIMTAMGRRIDENVMFKCVELIRTCRWAHIIAAGNTCPLAQYMGFRLGRLGVKCTYNVAAEYFMNQINLAEENDILIAISQSGTSRQVVQGMELGKEKQLKSIAITASVPSPVSELADYVLVSAGKEEPFSYYKGYEHLKEMAVIDALLHFVTTQADIEEDKLELILSDYKM